MHLICESDNLQDYLEETKEVDYSDPRIGELVERLTTASRSQEDYIRRTYEWVRDNIAHAWDIQSTRVTCAASEVLEFGEGICYAKSNLFSALLRKAGIPAGFCYQRLTLGDEPDTGYCIHALNAVYVASLNKWIRLDARGNKPGICAEFSLTEDRLAFPIREAYGEIDYPTIYAQPNPQTIAVLRQHTNSLTMYQNGLPSSL